MDRCCRSSQIGISRISFETSDGRFDSVCRLVALKGSASHFVFLDRGSVFWLEEALQTASSIGWKFPSVSAKSSSRRTVSVSAFVSQGSQFLKVSELCSNGKLFFVLIPAASSFEGWKSLLTICQEWIASVLAPPPPAHSSVPSSTQPISFASLFKGQSLSSQGRCCSSKESGCPGIEVEKDGVQERLSYLDSCLVFRFCSHAPIEWPRFRRWANRNWGTALNAPLQKLDDDLWLLFCDSKDKVDRILSLNRNSFGDIQILLDKWIPEAELSKVIVKEEVEWITIRGIPVHLCSTDFFRQIGPECGFFLAFETCSSLSSVRIKIRRVGALPEFIPVKFEGRIFQIQVTPDLSSSPVDSRIQDSRRKGTSFLSPLPSPRFGFSVFEAGSSSSPVPPPWRFSSPELGSSPAHLSDLSSDSTFPEVQTALSSRLTVEAAEKIELTFVLPREGR
ncbi:hypothetical protein LINPERHAP2_LOCUS10673 [Linum perenne]